MEIFLSIDGVLRNTIEKFIYHYEEHFLNSITEKDDNFEYGYSELILNDDLQKYFKFQSEDEFKHFLFIEYPLEIFGHAGASDYNVFYNLNQIIYDYPEHRFTLIGMDELSKSRPATLFFLSKNGYLGNYIRFEKSKDIHKLWKECDIWLTDNKNIIDLCPDDKISVKYNTNYNGYFNNKIEINKINETWLQFLEKTTTLTLTQ